MSPVITYFLALFIVLYFLVIVVEFISIRSIKRSFLELLLLVVFIIILNVTTGFPIPSSFQSFGGVSPIIAIAIMFVCTILGIVAHYFFSLKGKFSWRNLLKPLCVSPIVFLPLIGSVQSISNLESIQMFSFAILAFQNGFFWQKIFESKHEQI